MTKPLEATVHNAVAAPPPDERRVRRHLGLFGWSPEFTPRQWRIFFIVCTAGFFDQYDRVLLSLALKQIQLGLKIAEARLGLILSIIWLGYIFSLLLTPLADVFGRRRLLLYTIIGYTVFTGLSAIAPGERAFAAAQILARAFAGAEATVALVILAEEVDAAVRGWSIGLLTAISSCGAGIAALAFGLINVVPFGWRGLYALALIPLAVVIPLRRTLPESRRFEREKLEGLKPSNALQPVMALFREYPGRLAMTVTCAFLGNMGGNAAGIFFPKYVQEAHGWSPGNVSTLFFVGGALGILGSLVAGKASDRFGRRRMGALFLFVSPLLTIWIYSATNWTVIPAWIIELFCDFAANAILMAYAAELFPTSYRSTAGSALAVAGTTGSALGLYFEGVLFGFTGSHWSAIRYLTVPWMIAPIFVVLFYPETAGLELETISPEERRMRPVA